MEGRKGRGKVGRYESRARGNKEREADEGKGKSIRDVEGYFSSAQKVKKGRRNERVKKM